MKLSNVLLIAAFAGETLASWGFGKSAYNKWHGTELERWLSDHDIEYPKPADRKDLQKIVQDNWQSKIIEAYNGWDIPQLRAHLTDTGREIDKKQKENKNWLVQQVKSGWHETESTAQAAYGNVKDWIFDSWSESELKTFLDRHGIPNPTPAMHESLVDEARKNYNNVAEKFGETSAYPGNWLYESWSISDLKRWLDDRGYPAPRPTTRDKLISSVRRNSRLASIKDAKAKKSAHKTILDEVFDTWSESKLKEFLDKNNVHVPQGSTKNELLALARRNKGYLTNESVYSTMRSSYNSATSAVGDEASKATDSAYYYGRDVFDKAIEKWSDTRLKAYLDARGVPVTQASKRDELLSKVRLNKHKAANRYGVWTFDTWTYDNLKSWLEELGQKVSDGASASREQLASSAYSYLSTMSANAASASTSASATSASVGSKATDAAGYAESRVGSAASQATESAYNAGSKVAEAVTDGSKQAYASVTSALSQATAAVKDNAFETWSDSDLKVYLDSYGIMTYQGSARNEWIAIARRNAHYFRYGDQDQGMGGYTKSIFGYYVDYIMSFLGMGERKLQEAAKSTAEETKFRSEKAHGGAKDEL